MVPAGAVITGRIFSQNLVPPISPQVFEYGKVRRWVLRTPIPKRGMATKKDIQKNDRKGTGAGLAAGMESENKAPKTEKQKYEEYLSRLWSHKANEAVTVEIVAGGAYALASELVCLRLEHQYKNEGDRVNVGYSKNLKTWFFCMEVNI